MVLPLKTEPIFFFLELVKLEVDKSWEHPQSDFLLNGIIPSLKLTVINIVCIINRRVGVIVATYVLGKHAQQSSLESMMAHRSTVGLLPI